MNPTVLRSARTSIAVKIFVASVFHELSFFYGLEVSGKAILPVCKY